MISILLYFVEWLESAISRFHDIYTDLTINRPIFFHFSTTHFKPIHTTFQIQMKLPNFLAAAVAAFGLGKFVLQAETVANIH